MSRRFPVLIVFVFAVAARLFFAWAAGDGFETRGLWVPIVYSVAAACLILSSLIAVGLKDSGKSLIAAYFVWLFQWFALAVVVLREPGHALAAERLHWMTGVPAFAALFFVSKRADSVLSRSICIPALLVVAAAPPTPGFFALIEMLSAFMHGKLPQLACLVAFSQICLFFVASKELFLQSREPVSALISIEKES